MECKSPAEEQEEAVMTCHKLFYCNMQIVTADSDRFSTETSVVHPGSAPQDSHVSFIVQNKSGPAGAPSQNVL